MSRLAETFIIICRSKNRPGSQCIKVVAVSCLVADPEARADRSTGAYPDIYSSYLP